MYPYLVTFMISILLCAAGEYLRERYCRQGSLTKGRVRGIQRNAPAAAASALFFCAAVLLPVLLAGARDYRVGTDITTYGNYVFDGALKSYCMPPLFKSIGGIEPLYRILAFGVSRLTNNAHWFYFATALIICTGFMAGLLHWRRYCSVTLGWAAFLFLFYGDTLNTMRQSLAISLVFWGFALFTEEKYVRFCLLQAAAAMFHITGVIGIFLAVLYWLEKKGMPRQVQFFFIAACFGGVLFYSPILQAVLNAGLLPRKFSRYIADGIAFALNPTILRLPFLLPILYYYDRFCSGGAEALLRIRREPGSAVPGRVFFGGEEDLSSSGLFSSKTDGGAADRAELDSGVTDRAELYSGGADSAESDGGVADRAELYSGGEDSAELYSGMTDSGIKAFGAFLAAALLLEICTVQLRSVRPALYRISQYFGCFRFPAYARLVRILRRDNRALTTALLFAFFIAVWYYQNVIQGNNQIFPYVWAPRWFERMVPVFPELPNVSDLAGIPEYLLE